MAATDITLNEKGTRRREVYSLMYSIVRSLEYIDMADKLRSAEGMDVYGHTGLTGFISKKREEVAKRLGSLKTADARHVLFMKRGITSKNPWNQLESIIHRKIVRTNKG